MNIQTLSTMKYFKTILCVMLLVMIGVACEDNPDKFPINIEELQKPENTGGFLRVVSIEQGAFDLLDIPNAAFVITLEADDAENGGQLESVDFFVGFSDNNAETIGDQEEVGPIVTFDASAFAVNEESGLPRATLTIPAQDALDALGMQESDLGSADTFDFRWRLNLTNGKSFSSDNTGLNVSGGAFFNSPFQRQVIVGRLVDQSKYVGTYMVTQQSPSSSVSAAFQDPNGWIFDGSDEDSETSQSIMVELSVDPDNGINGRVMSNAQYLPAFGGTSEWKFALIRGQTTAENRADFPKQTSGLGCGGTIFLGPGTPNGSFDVSDDSQFTMFIVENTDADCGLPAIENEFVFTKQ